MLGLEHDDDYDNAEDDADTVEDEVPSFYHMQRITLTIAYVGVRVGSELLLIVSDFVDDRGHEDGNIEEDKDGEDDIEGNFLCIFRLMVVEVDIELGHEIGFVDGGVFEDVGVADITYEY